MSFCGGIHRRLAELIFLPYLLSWTFFAKSKFLRGLIEVILQSLILLSLVSFSQIIDSYSRFFFVRSGFWVLEYFQLLLHKLVLCSIYISSLLDGCVENHLRVILPRLSLIDMFWVGDASLHSFYINVFFYSCLLAHAFFSSFPAAIPRHMREIDLGIIH